MLIEAWVKVASGAIAIQEGDANGALTSLGDNLNAVVANGAWTKYTYTIMPKAGARKLSVRFVASGAGSTDAYVDRVTVRLARGLNLLADPGFEQDLDANGVADIWTKTGSATVSLSGAEKASGSYGQRIQSTGYGNGILQEWIGVSPNTTYTLTVNAKVSGGSLAVAYGGSHQRVRLARTDESGYDRRERLAVEDLYVYDGSIDDQAVGSAARMVGRRERRLCRRRAAEPGGEALAD
ncbi:carbohydrate binding domain-containing protein [Cohnella rhizosphaerae]|uniref:CBM-cenC domain-containing protein n=1 Tax=Cohnella rhizosphaerae TaxID=1457232 RepID=A0A9X4KSX5_9BACL|nr:hypothetical protein [Cohnella rhizosphaerae]MDG0809963.1 hypothetical protein [Cohnella rhizosphaerae]